MGEGCCLLPAGVPLGHLNKDRGGGHPIPREPNAAGLQGDRRLRAGPTPHPRTLRSRSCWDPSCVRLREVRSRREGWRLTGGSPLGSRVACLPIHPPALPLWLRADPESPGRPPGTSQPPRAERPHPPRPRGAPRGAPPPPGLRPQELRAAEGRRAFAPAPACWRRRRRDSATPLRARLAHIALGELVPPLSLCHCGRSHPPPPPPRSRGARPQTTGDRRPDPGATFRRRGRHPLLPYCTPALPPGLPVGHLRGHDPGDTQEVTGGGPRPPHSDTRVAGPLCSRGGRAAPSCRLPAVAASTPRAPSASRSSPRPGGGGGRLLGVRGRPIGGFLKAFWRGERGMGGAVAKALLAPAAAPPPLPALRLLRSSPPAPVSPEPGSAGRRDEGAGAQDRAADRYRRLSPPATVRAGAERGAAAGVWAAPAGAAGGGADAR